MQKIPVLNIPPLDKMLTVLDDDHWRHVRGKLTPGFSTGKLKRVCHLPFNTYYVRSYTCLHSHKLCVLSPSPDRLGWPWLLIACSVEMRIKTHFCVAEQSVERIGRCALFHLTTRTHNSYCTLLNRRGSIVHLNMYSKLVACEAIL